MALWEQHRRSLSRIYLQKTNFLLFFDLNHEWKFLFCWFSVKLSFMRALWSILSLAFFLLLLFHLCAHRLFQFLIVQKGIFPFCSVSCANLLHWMKLNWSIYVLSSFWCKKNIWSYKKKIRKRVRKHAHTYTYIDVHTRSHIRAYHFVHL